MENIEELPIQRFYFSMTHLLALSSPDDRLPTDCIRSLYVIVDNYYLESLAILRSSKKSEKRIIEEIELELQESRLKIAKLQELKKDMTPSDAEYANIVQARYVSDREGRFKSKDLEGEMNSSAAIVMFLSLLESTLLRLTKVLIENDFTLPKMQDVMDKRDNGIIKYLKYFEKYIEQQEKQFIVGTKKYNMLMFWLKIRNNIVHSNNLVTEEILNDATRLKVELDINRYSNKFCFKYKDVMNVASICGDILDECIEKGLYCYFSVED